MGVPVVENPAFLAGFLFCVLFMEMCRLAAMAVRFLTRSARKRGNDMRDDDFFEAVVAVGELMSWLSVLFCFCYQLFGIVDINNISFSFAGIAALLIFIVFFIIPMTSIMAIVAIPASFIFAFVFMGVLHIFCSIVRFFLRKRS